MVGALERRVNDVRRRPQGGGRARPQRLL